VRVAWGGGGGGGGVGGGGGGGGGRGCDGPLPSPARKWQQAGRRTPGPFRAAGRWPWARAAGRWPCARAAGRWPCARLLNATSSGRGGGRRRAAGGGRLAGRGARGGPTNASAWDRSVASRSVARASCDASTCTPQRRYITGGPVRVACFGAWRWPLLHAPTGRPGAGRGGGRTSPRPRRCSSHASLPVQPSGSRTPSSCLSGCARRHRSTDSSSAERLKCVLSSAKKSSSGAAARSAPSTPGESVATKTRRMP